MATYSLQEFILDDGSTRKMGNNMPYPTDPMFCKGTYKTYGSVPDQPMVPRDSWVSLVPDHNGPEDPDIGYVHDQNGKGQCNADATTGAVEDTHIKSGLPLVELSAADLYDQINDGADNGSLLEDAIRVMMSGGVGPASVSGKIWDPRMKRSTPEQRSHAMVKEAFLCPTFDHCYSASMSGFRIVSGIFWYDNYNVDNDGYLPLSGRGNFGGHAIKGYKPTRRGNRFAIWHTQSWGTWGLNRSGAFAINETNYGKGIGGWWAIRVVTDDGGSAPIKAD